MTNLANYLDTVFFSVFPYVAMVVFLVGTIHRYRNETFTYSSLSSQLLETSINGATRVLVNVTSGNDLTLAEFTEAADQIGFAIQAYFLLSLL